MTTSAAAARARLLEERAISATPSRFDDLVAAAIRRMPRVLFRPDARRDLTDEEAALLKEGGLDLEARPFPSGSPLDQGAAEFAALVTTGLTTAATARVLSVNDSRIRQRLTQQPPTLYGIRLDGEWRIPSFQFDGDRLLPGLGEVLARLDPDLHPLAVYRWFVAPHPDLLPAEEGGDEPLSPRDWLRGGHPPAAVAELAGLL